MKRFFIIYGIGQIVALYAVLIGVAVFGNYPFGYDFLIGIVAAVLARPLAKKMELI